MNTYPSNSTVTFPRINQDFIDLSGCNIIDLLPIDDKSKEIINKALSGELFINPLQNPIGEAFELLGNAINELADATIGQLADDIQRMVDDAGNALEGVLQVDTRIPDPDNPGQFLTRAENVFEFVSRKANEVTGSVEYLQQQTEILSGVSLLPKDRRASDFDYNSDGGIDEFPGLVGVTNIAQGFNQTTNSLSNPDELEDRFSGFFDSVTGAGSELMESFNDAARGGLVEALAPFRDGDGNLQIPEFDPENPGGSVDLSQVSDAFESINEAAEAIEALINNERALVALAVDYLAKTVLGFSILALLADPCFGKIIAEKIFDL